MKTLIIVESPTKAQVIQKYLGEEYKVLASKGSIVDIAKSGYFNTGIDFKKNYKPRYVLMDDKIQTLDAILNEAHKADNILLCCDPDREGNAIAYHLKEKLTECGVKTSIKQIETQEITKDAMKKAIAQTKDINLNIVRSQETRRILDRIVGFMVSTFLMNFYGTSLSAGRVQSVAVRMIADREREIKKFKPEEYWNLGCLFSAQNDKFKSKFNIKIQNKEKLDTYLNKINNCNSFFVKKVKSQDKSEKPLPPFTTASLQQFMSRKYGFEPDYTMKLAQNLYENGYCSYIRTDSVRTSDEALTSLRSFLKNNNFTFPKKPNIFSTKDSAQDAHECIRPTNISNLPDNSILVGDERKLYKSIWEQFVASQMNPAIWSTLTVDIADESGDLKFRSSGKALKEEGFLKIFGEKSPDKIEIPNLQENQEVSLIKESIKYEQKFTQPPPRYNDASLIKTLESEGIGRPATYAEIIKKIAMRNYVEKDGSTYRPTELGMKITNILIEYFDFMNYEYTSELEKKLDKIADGEIDKNIILNEFFIPFKEKLNKAFIDCGGKLCEKCGNPLLLRVRSSDKEKFYACSNYIYCKNYKSINNV